VLVAFTSGDLWRIALSIFLLAVGLTLGFVFIRLAETVRRLSSFVTGAEREVLPVINKIGGSVDRVNDQLDKVDQITDSAVDAVESADTAVRAVSFAITKPVQKITGFATGVSYGAADFKSRRDWRSAVQAGKEAAARREHELDEELRESAEEARRPHV
jgi:methyl-accepting chemotaxis protein